MPKFRKKPIEATQWFRNGDHPQDRCYYIDDKSPDRFLSEGKVVRYFRHPDIPGKSICKHCGLSMHKHGWIDVPEDDKEFLVQAVIEEFKEHGNLVGVSVLTEQEFMAALKIKESRGYKITNRIKELKKEKENKKENINKNLWDIAKLYGG